MSKFKNVLQYIFNNIKFELEYKGQYEKMVVKFHMNLGNTYINYDVNSN